MVEMRYIYIHDCIDCDFLCFDIRILILMGLVPRDAELLPSWWTLAI